MRGVCPSCTRTERTEKGRTTKGSSKTSVIYGLTGLNILGTPVPPIIVLRRKGERFFFPSEALTTNTETSAKLPVFASTFRGCCKTPDGEGLSEVCSQVLRPGNTHWTKLSMFYCTAGASWEGRAIQNAYPTLQCGNGSWETEKLFKIAPWFIRNNSEVDTSPTFHPTHRFITDIREMQALKNQIPAPIFLAHKASCWVLAVTSATAELLCNLTRWFIIACCIFLRTSQADDIMIKMGGENKM